MAELEKSPHLIEALRGALTPKFLASRSPEGEPNVVPLTSLQPSEHEADILYFGNFLLRKTIQNLERDARVGVVVVTPELRAWTLTADFLRFETDGPYADRQRNAELLRYNAYTGIRNAGILRTRTVEARPAASRSKLVWEFARARAAGVRSRQPGGTSMPLAVRREFARLAAIKVMAWIGNDGYPRLVPVLSLQPAGPAAFVCWAGMAAGPWPDVGATVAANVLTLEAVSFQVKGTFTRKGQAGVLLAHAAYAGGPPLPGGQVA